MKKLTAALAALLALTITTARADEPHTVQPGEYLTLIADEHYGDASLAWAIAKANGIADPDLIYPGQTLTIPEDPAYVPPYGPPLDLFTSYVEPPRPAPPPVSGRGDGDVVSIIHAVFSSYGLDRAYAVAVARCESSLNPRAVGAAGEVGLMQLHPIHRPWVESMGYRWTDLYDPTVNATVAARLVLRNGSWSAWSCAR